MATIAEPVRRPLNKDRIFFPSMCLLIVVIVWLGFSKSYYAAGMVRAHLPSHIIHIHAVIFSLWLITLMVQTGLVSAKKVQLHCKLGLWGFGLAALVVVVGLMATTDSLRRNVPPPPGFFPDPKVFYFGGVSIMLLFATFIGWAYMSRRRPAEHKRLIMYATILLVNAAVGRFPLTIAPMGITTVNIIFCRANGSNARLRSRNTQKVKSRHHYQLLTDVAWLFTREPLGMTSP
jgi:hypothetical protein